MTARSRNALLLLGVCHRMLVLHLLTIGFVWATALLLGRTVSRASRWGGDDDVPFVAAPLFSLFARR